MAETAIEQMELFGVNDLRNKKDNLSLFALVSTSQQGEDLRDLVRKQLHQSSDSDPKLLIKGILILMWATIKDTGNSIFCNAVEPLQRHLLRVAVTFYTCTLFHLAKADPAEEMQFVLMIYGSAVLVTELQRIHPEDGVADLGKCAYEV